MKEGVPLLGPIFHSAENPDMQNARDESDTATTDFFPGEEDQSVQTYTSNIKPGDEDYSA